MEFDYLNNQISLFKADLHLSYM